MQRKEINNILTYDGAKYNLVSDVKEYLIEGFMMN